MSELINTDVRCSSPRWLLLATVSAATLTASVYSHKAEAADGDSDRPTVWIELGGQFERIDSAQALFAPPFFDAASTANVTSMIDSQRPPAYGIGGESRITFAPEDSDWVFSAGVRYGRSNGARHTHHQTSARTPSPGGMIFQTSRVFFGDGQTEFHESHYVLDFQAGKDVGLGLFGWGSSSVVSIGVRFAQFNSNSSAVLHARPFLHDSPNPTNPAKYNLFNIVDREYTGIAQTRRDVRGVGPSLSWDASLPLFRSGAHAIIDFDWGANAAILFGRQRSRVNHQTAEYYYERHFSMSPVVQYGHSSHTAHRTRARNITIPNIGGFAGISLKFPNAKVALGYRADFFLGAMDNGLDSAKKENIGYYGPFATISFGFGG